MAGRLEAVMGDWCTFLGLCVFVAFALGFIFASVFRGGERDDKK